MRRSAFAASITVVSLCSPLAPVPADAAVATCLGKPATMVFGNGPDHVVGTSGDDVVVLGGGNDQYSTRGGNDLVCAGSGDDWVSAVDPGRTRIDLGSGDDHAQAWYQGSVKAGPGDDTVIAGYTQVVHGGPGRDELKSEIGTPRLFGDAGDDVFQVGLSRPSLDGGRGRDTVGFWFGDEPVSVDLARKRAVNESAGTIPLVHVENVTGTDFADVLRGDGHANVLTGNGGADVLVGRGGRDRADGGEGRDRCTAETRVSC